jgi:hypothetical protein
MRALINRHRVAVLAALGTALMADSLSSANTRRFFDDDPLQREPASQDASRVAEWDIELLTDLVFNLFTQPGDRAHNVRAGNINTIDEVPDSTWFTNRIGSRHVTIEEAVRGPLAGRGPADGRWEVIAPKRSGAAPGFTMRDAKGERWFVSFDSVGHPEAATAAILVANKLFWTLGYWQVENYLISVRREQLDVASTAKFKPMSGITRPMTRHDLDEVFARSHRSADGSYRAVAARAVPGRPVGGFRYYGTRPDDPNDVVPHEHRRELRALKVFGAWTNLVDMKAGNTLDTVVTENGKSVVRHYLQDVGSTFGTGANGPREYDEGWEYLVDLDLVRKRFFRIGFPLGPWHTTRYVENDAVGRFEGTTFDPAQWKPRVPTAAIRHARRDDTFWAARRVAAFSDEMIRATVKTGLYSNPNDETLLADVLIQRRDTIAKLYLNALNPLVEFSLSVDGHLTFRNAAVDARVAAPPDEGYRATWSLFDNETRAVTLIGQPTVGAGPAIAAPAPLPSSPRAIVRIGIVPRGTVPESWTEPVEVYFRRLPSGWQLVGVDRLGPPE